MCIDDIFPYDCSLMQAVIELSCGGSHVGGQPLPPNCGVQACVEQCYPERNGHQIALYVQQTMRHFAMNQWKQGKLVGWSQVPPAPSSAPTAETQQPAAPTWSASDYSVLKQIGCTGVLVMPDEVQAKLINNNQKCIVDAHNKEFNPHRKTIADPAAGQKRPRDDNDASVQEQMEVGKIPQPDGKNTYSQLSSEFSELQTVTTATFKLYIVPQVCVFGFLLCFCCWGLLLRIY